MTHNAMRQEQEPAWEPVDEAVDHVRGSPAGHLIVEYGDYECPYSRQAFRATERVDRELGEGVRFAFRHFPLSGIPPARPRRPLQPRPPHSRAGSGKCTGCCFTGRRHSRTMT
jgi:protein-disulfide isomerase